jgi:hypothetical protein
MPFTPRLLTGPMPNVPPDVDIIFHGQILLRSDGVTCEAALNPLATNHVLTIEARTKTRNQSDVIAMRHIGPLQYRRPGMTIGLDPPAKTLASWKCIGDRPIDYAGGGGNPYDFRWILNLEGRYFHERRLDPEIFNSDHVIRREGGEYYFYTGVRSTAGLKVRRSGGGKEDYTFNRIGAVVRASLYLEDDQSVFMRWMHEGAERSVPLTKTAGVRHEIYIENTPLFDYEADELEKHEELREYYKVIPGFDEMERFTLTPFRPEQFGDDDGDFGTPSIPCQVLRLDEDDD